MVVFMDKVVLREEKVGGNGSKLSFRTPCTTIHQGSSAEVYTHGGHVTSWRSPAGKVRPRRWRLKYHVPTNGMQGLIFLSKKAIFEPPKAIRWKFMQSLTASIRFRAEFFRTQRGYSHLFPSVRNDGAHANAARICSKCRV